MSMQLPADLNAAVQSFLVSGRYADEEEVLREALAVLRKRERDFAAIQEGVADMEAGRVRPWSEAKAAIEAKHGFDGGSS